MKFTSINEFPTDTPLEVTKSSIDSTLSVGDIVWVDSQDRYLNHLSGGWVSEEDLTYDTVFSAEFKLNTEYKCFTKGRSTIIIRVDQL